MKDEFGIGFVTGRTNVCRVINSYYQNILDQVKRYKEEVKVTFFVLFDTSYQQEKREDFYQILPEVYKEINVIYITPEDIGEEVKKLVSRQNMNIDDMNSFCKIFVANATTFLVKNIENKSNIYSLYFYIFNYIKF